jgi:PAS domain S-box-containing protein
MELQPFEYRTLVEQAPIMIWRANRSAACDYFNDRWLSFTGRSMEQEIGNGWAAGVHPEDLDFCLRIFTTHFEKREIFEMRYRLKRYDGQYRWLFDRGVPFYGENKEFGGYIGSCIDITEQVLADAYLARQREKELAELRGLLPICANCKSIRDDQGTWHTLEEYIKEHSSTDFTHGICPACRKMLMGEDA